MTLEDYANKLLLPILGDIDPSSIQLSTNEEDMDAKLHKGIDGGNWIGVFTKASTAACRAAFIVFWLCKFIFGSYPYYAVKVVYFRLTNKIFVGVSGKGVPAIFSPLLFTTLFFRTFFGSAVLPFCLSTSLFTMLRRSFSLSLR